MSNKIDIGRIKGTSPERLSKLAPVQCELEEVADLEKAEHQADRRRHQPTLWVVHETELDQPHPAAAIVQFAPTVGQDVAHPLRVRSVGEGDDEAPGPTKHIDRCPVLAVRPAPRMHHHAKARHISCQRADYPIGQTLVDARNRASALLSVGQAALATARDILATIPQ